MEGLVFAEVFSEDPAELDRIYAGLKRELMTRERLVFLLEMKGPGSGSKAGNRYFHFVETSTRKIRDRVLALGLVLPVFRERFMVRIYCWMGPPPIPYKILATREEGMAWARGVLAGG